MTEEFRPFQKIPRLSRPVVITEKIDGTNASIFIGPCDLTERNRIAINHTEEHGELMMMAGSRTRWITPQDDNFGFARWVQKHAEELFTLGPGHHFGEWWGRGIQRHYDLKERRFSLFNTARWLTCTGESMAPACCSVVPVLARGVFSSVMVEGVMETLREIGSFAAPGFANPEGIVVYHTASGHLFKKTCEHDDEPKNAHPKKERVPQERKPKDPSKGGRRVGCEGYTGPERRAT